MDESPPVFLLDPPSVCRRPCSLLPAQEKGHQVLCLPAQLLGSCRFTMLMICIISINAISLALETSYRCRLCRGTFSEVTDAFFIAIHTTELLLKLYAGPIAYWKSSYNTLDAAILLVAFLPHALPADTAARTHLEVVGLQRSPDPPHTQAHQVRQRDEETLGQTLQK